MSREKTTKERSATETTAGEKTAGETTRFNFEKTLTELEQLVVKMEQGEFSLEESLKQFERGVALTRACQKALADAEQKVQMLIKDGESARLDTLAPDSPDSTDSEPAE